MRDRAAGRRPAAAGWEGGYRESRGGRMSLRAARPAVRHPCMDVVRGLCMAEMAEAAAHGSRTEPKQAPCMRTRSRPRKGKPSSASRMSGAEAAKRTRDRCSRRMPGDRLGCVTRRRLRRSGGEAAARRIFRGCLGAPPAPTPHLAGGGHGRPGGGSLRHAAARVRGKRAAAAAARMRGGRGARRLRVPRGSQRQDPAPRAALRKALAAKRGL